MLHSLCWPLLVVVHVTSTPPFPLLFLLPFSFNFILICLQIACWLFFGEQWGEECFVYFTFFHDSPPITLSNILPAFARGSCSGSQRLATTGKEPHSQLHPLSLAVPSLSTELLQRRPKELLSTSPTTCFTHMLVKREEDLLKQNRKAVAPAGC